MIITMRNQLKQSTYRYVIFFLVFIIALSMASSLFIKSERGGGATWAIRINGSEVPYQEFAREVAKQTEYLAHIRAQYGQYADLLFQSLGWSLDPKSHALDILIKEELLKQYSEKLSIKLHPDYINKILNNAQFVKQNLGHIVPPFVFDQAGMLDMNIVKSFLKQNRMTAQQFEYAIEQALIKMQALDYIATASYVPVFDVKQQFIAKYLNKQFSYLTFSFDHYLAEEKKSNISNEELQTFYDTQNLQLRRYWVPEKRNGLLFKFKPENYNIIVSETEIQRYYEDNKVKNYVLDPLKVEVQQIFLEQVASATGKSVVEIEKALLIDSSSEYNKYWKSVKPFARGEHKGEFEKNAFVLQNEGDKSSVFESKEGPTIIKLVRRIPRTYKPLILVRKEIESLLINKAFKKVFVKDIKNVLSQDDAKGMEAFIAEKAGNKEIVSNIFKDDTFLSQQLFSLKKGQYGFFVENGVGMAVLLTDVIERHLPDLASIRDVVKNDLYESKATKILQNHIVQAQKDSASESLQSLQSKFNVSLNNTDMLDPNDHKKNQDVSKKGLPVQEMMSMEKENSILVYHGDRNSFLIKLNKIESFDENRFLSVEKDVRDHLGGMRTKLLLNGAIASLHRNATIEINESILITSEEYSE